ncbi:MULTISPECIES: NAD(P)/FAD-dependent oxidoreductase [Nitrospirillum]|uniref:Gamma-glutamylputrescine oxidase n=1 Tax=Nitrospirillum amazonense TaxID=28077 RepID=A0A560G543_9PROT|nr:FAD-binding oxidoreductase [Nitrospirillum amazonense]MEC4591405.1 FAD-binding oxidoreductase [Nitrospirillum amazonense]TWB28934.1 gamma-glutamylputrescine oxidase [Nitrospirillum amazonense]
MATPPPDNWPDSWYVHSSPPAPAVPALAGNTDCDVCVVGAGYTGLSAALTLAERGYDVVVVEAERVGWGASGRNGGQLISGYNKSIGAIARLGGADNARRLWALAEEAKALLVRRVERHGIACALRWGYINAAAKPRHRRDLLAQLRDADGVGYDRLRLVEGEALRALLASPRYDSGLEDMGSGHLHPLAYAQGLGRAAREAGARLYENTPALAITTGAAPVVTTPRGRVRSRFLVLAGNAYLGDLAPPLTRTLVPIVTYMLATQPLGAERAAALLPGDHAVSDTDVGLHYFRRSADHRLLFGGRVNYANRATADAKPKLARDLAHCFPQLEDVGIDHFWHGSVGMTVSRLPQLGRLSPTTYYAHGYSGHGVALTGICGQLLAEAIMGQAERYDVFARLPQHPFVRGPWRVPLLVLAGLWYRLHDLL